MYEAEGGSEQFPALSTWILMGHNNHSLSIDATIIVSNSCSITGEHVSNYFRGTIGYHSNAMASLKHR